MREFRMTWEALGLFASGTRGIPAPDRLNPVRCRNSGAARPRARILHAAVHSSSYVSSRSRTQCRPAPETQDHGPPPMAGFGHDQCPRIGRDRVPRRQDLREESDKAAPTPIPTNARHSTRRGDRRRVARFALGRRPCVTVGGGQHLEDVQQLGARAFAADEEERHRCASSTTRWARSREVRSVWFGTSRVDARGKGTG